MDVTSGTFLMYDFKFNIYISHNEMDCNNFNKWVKNQLIPGLPVESIVLLHNTSYPNKQENKATPSISLKYDIQSSIRNTNITTEFYKIITVHSSEGKLFEVIALN
jgi:hypothetical protein